MSSFNGAPTQDAGSQSGESFNPNDQERIASLNAKFEGENTVNPELKYPDTGIPLNDPTRKSLMGLESDVQETMLMRGVLMKPEEVLDMVKNHSFKIARRLTSKQAGNFNEGISKMSEDDKAKIATALVPHFDKILSMMKHEAWSDFTRDELDKIVMMSSLPRPEKLSLLSKE
jgi:hypothetical protein